MKIEKITPSGIGTILAVISFMGFLSAESTYERLITTVVFFFGSLMIFGEHLTKIPKFLNRWLTNQQEQELRPVELQLLAAEHELAFIEKDDDFEAEVVHTLKEITSPPTEFKHFIVGTEPNGQFRIFESDASQAKHNSMVVTSAQFEFQTVPTLLLVHKSVQHIYSRKADLLSLTSTFDYLDAEYFPGWLFPTEFDCFYQGENADAVSRFLESNRPFSFVTNESSVRIICFDQHYVCAFYDRVLESDGSNLMQFKRLALRMLELQGDEVEPQEKGPDLA